MADIGCSPILSADFINELNPVQKDELLCLCAVVVVVISHFTPADYITYYSMYTFPVCAHNFVPVSNRGLCGYFGLSIA